MSSVLYITYDGLTDHISESQVLPYVLGLAERGFPMALLSFEKEDAPAEKTRAVEARLRAANVKWIRGRYLRGSASKTIPGHLSQGFLRALMARIGPVRAIHARSYIPSILGLGLARLYGAPFLLDMRGFWVDEKVETGLWPRGWLYRAGKTIEGPMFRGADAIVSLTQAGKDELRKWPGLEHTPIEVIPTCVALDRFPLVQRERRGLTVGYVGSFGERYLTDDMIAIFAELRRRRSEARLLVLSPAPGQALDDALARHAIPRDAVRVESVPHAEVGRRLAEMDLTVCLVKPGFASLASCPTKFGESLATGAPVIANHGVGDCARIVLEDRVGVATDLDRTTYGAVAEAALALLREPDLERRCRAVAEGRFSLDRAIDAYAAIYASLRRESPRRAA